MGLDVDGERGRREEGLRRSDGLQGCSESQPDYCYSSRDAGCTQRKTRSHRWPLRSCWPLHTRSFRASIGPRTCTLAPFLERRLWQLLKQLTRRCECSAREGVCVGPDQSSDGHV